MAGARWVSLRRRASGPETVPLVLLLVLIAVTVVAMELLPVIPVSALVLPLVLGGLLLESRQMPWLVLAAMVAVAVVLLRQDDVTTRGLISAGVTAAVGVLILLVSYRRAQLGVARMRGDAMLVDLRDRIQRQGRLPALPDDWDAQSGLKSAEGTAFAGDFQVAFRAGDRLELAVVDVSGKGVGAGTRGLVLSGAFGGLLGALPPHEFLPAANDFVLRQGWEEGFASAVHLSVDLGTGEFSLWNAGHPPAVQLDAGSGRWQTLECEGPILGVLPDAEFHGLRGQMRRGDVVMLYTDGLVETPDRELSQGIDRLLGQAERILHRGPDEAVERLLDRLGGADDDRCLVMLRRE